MPQYLCKKNVKTFARKWNNVSFHNLISFHLIYSGCDAKDSQKRELNHCTSQEPNVEKTRKEVSVLDVGGKPKKNIPGKTHKVG